MQKRRFPTTIVLINVGSGTTDFDSGNITSSETRHTIRRVISHPESLSMFGQSGGLFRLSGSIGESIRLILIDKTDLRDVTIDTDTKVELEGRKWDVTKVIDHENVIYEVWLKDIEGSPL